MSVDLRNFVQVNLNYFKRTSLNQTRDTAVLITCNCNQTAPKDRLNGSYSSLVEYEQKIKEVNASLDPADQIVDNKTNPVLYNYVKCFFDNGGVKLHIVGGYQTPLYYVWNTSAWEEETEEPSTGTELTLVSGDYYGTTGDYYIWNATSQIWEASTTAGTGSELTLSNGDWYAVTSDDQHIADWIYNEVIKLDYTEIVITSDANENILRMVQETSGTTNTITNVLTNQNLVKTLTGYKEKIFISSTADEDLVISEVEHQHPNYVIKFGTKGIEMATAAYLTQINLSNGKTIADYCYTMESVIADSDVINDNDKVVKLANKHFNLDTLLVNSIRNVFGDTVNGLDLMNYYMRIVLVQTLTERIMAVLASKIKYDKSGINKVINTMTQELDVYKNNGFLNVETIWTEDDLYYRFNGIDYLICKRNTPLTSGYKFVILPLTSLTPEQREGHAFPPVYLLISDSISIRQILISGDIY